MTVGWSSFGCAGFIVTIGFDGQAMGTLTLLRGGAACVMRSPGLIRFGISSRRSSSFSASGSGTSRKLRSGTGVLAGFSTGRAKGMNGDVFGGAMLELFVPGDCNCGD